jgi:hypothetical protein
MKLTRNFLLFLVIVCLNSCETPDYAYIRNLTNNTAIIDVFLLKKREMKTLPNKVRISNRVVQFKGGYRKYFLDSTQNVVWLDTSHFKFEINAHSTADLSDMIGAFQNSSPRNPNIRLTITSSNKTDTLLTGNGWEGFRRKLFAYKHIWFGRPVLYYDIK